MKEEKNEKYERKISERTQDIREDKEAVEITQHEDQALKVATQYLGEEVMEFFQIEGKVKYAAPTESIYMELKRMYQDFNFVMEDGTWKHFEFQSRDGGIKDLKRFRAYEAVLSQQQDVSVTTYVLYSGNVKNPVTEYTEGVNTYRIVPLVLKDYDAEQYFEEIRKKLREKIPVDKKDLVPVALCTLMGGKSTQKEKIHEAFEILHEIKELPKELIQKIEAVVYIMADKFLEEKEMENLKEELKMTRLGQMLWNDGKMEGERIGMERGMERGIERGIEHGVKAVIESCKMLKASWEQALDLLKEKMNLSQEQATEFMKKYW